MVLFSSNFLLMVFFNINVNIYHSQIMIDCRSFFIMSSNYQDSLVLKLLHKCKLFLFKEMKWSSAQVAQKRL